MTRCWPRHWIDIKRTLSLKLGAWVYLGEDFYLSQLTKQALGVT